MMEIFYNLIIENLIVIIITFVAMVFFFRILIKDKTIALLSREALSFREILEFSPDAFFVWLTDSKKNIFPMASRKLSIMLRLEKGRSSSFSEILEKIENPKELEDAIDALQKDGTRFITEVKAKDKERYFLCEGNKIATFAGDELACIVWFKDITELFVLSQNNEDVIGKLEIQKNYYEKIIDALPFPIWIRNDGQLIFDCNQSYVDAVETTSKAEVQKKHIELGQDNDVKEIRALSVMARKEQKSHRGIFSIILNSQIRNVEINETMMGENYTVGWAREMTAMEHDYEKISEQKEMGFAALNNSPFAILILDEKLKVKYYNDNLFKLWDIKKDFMNSFFMLEDFLRELKRLGKLPENRDFTVYKEQQLKFYKNLKELHSDTIYLSDEITIKRTIIPLNNGGTITYFEDISQIFKAERNFYALSENYKKTLDNIDKAVIIFGENGRVKIANKAFTKLWGLDFDDIDNLLLTEVLDFKKKFFDRKYNWIDVKSEMLSHITSGNMQVLSMERNDNKVIDCLSTKLVDGSIMLSYSEIK